MEEHGMAVPGKAGDGGKGAASLETEQELGLVGG